MNHEHPHAQQISSPQPLHYAVDVEPPPQILSLVVGVLMGLFLIGLALILFAFALLALRQTHGTTVELSQGILGIVLLLIAVFIAVCGAVQLLASFAAMWRPTKFFWWDKWFVTIGRHKQKPDQ